MKYFSRNETIMAGSELLKTLLSHNDRATVLALSGELGSGKTTFVQGIARALDVSQHIVSPTFVIEKRYRLGADDLFSQLIHIDAYRLDGTAAAGVLRFEETIREPHALVVIEWPERLGVPLPDDTVYVRFTHGGGDVRDIAVASG